jgi:hypothetical protein
MLRKINALRVPPDRRLGAPDAGSPGEREGPDMLQVKMWLYPYLTYLSYLSIFCILAVFVLMAFNPDRRPKLLSTLLGVEVVLAAHMLHIRFGGHLPIRDEETASGKPAR